MRLLSHCLFNNVDGGLVFLGLVFLALFRGGLPWPFKVLWDVLAEDFSLHGVLISNPAWTGQARLLVRRFYLLNGAVFGYLQRLLARLDHITAEECVHLLIAKDTLRRLRLLIP